MSNEALPRLLQNLGGGLAAAGLRVVGPARVQRALRGSMALTGCETAVCLKRIGELARVPLTARAFAEATGTTYVIEVVLTEAATGKVALRLERRCDVCTLKEANDALSMAARDAGKRLILQWTPPPGSVTGDEPGSGEGGHGEGGHGEGGHGEGGHDEGGHGEAGSGKVGQGEARPGDARPGEAGHGKAGHGKAGEGKGDKKHRKRTGKPKDGARGPGLTDPQRVDGRDRHVMTSKQRLARLVGIIAASSGVAFLVPGAVLLGLHGKTTDGGCGAKKCVYDTVAGGGVMTGLGVAALLAGGGLLVYSFLRRGQESQGGPVGSPEGFGRGSTWRFGVAPLAGGGWIQLDGRF